MARAIVFAGGGSPVGPVAEYLTTPDGPVIAADSGLDHARALGYEPTHVIGDLDSISADGLAWAEDAGVMIEQYPSDKDATDLELALARAVNLADEVVVVEGGAGRLDHLMANVALLASPRWADTAIVGLVGVALVSVVHPGRPRTVTGAAASIVTLLAAGGSATGVTTRGLRWGLDNARIDPGTSLGVSNEMLGTEARVAITSGVLLAIQPHALGSPTAAASGGSGCPTGGVAVPGASQLQLQAETG